MSTIKVDTYLTRGGASEIAIDKLKGASSAGSLIIVGEGGTATTVLQQGLCKVRYAFDLQTSQNTFEGSFNCASGTDNGGGDCTITFTNAMSDQNYTPATSSADSDITHTQADRTDGNASRVTTNFKSRVRDNGGTLRDGIHYVSLFGDLA